VIIRNVVIADRAPWSEPFVDAEQLHVSLKLLPLLKGDIQVGNIRIDRPRIRLAKGSDGWNLDDLIRPTARGAATEPHRTEGTRATRGQPGLPVLLAGTLAIRHGALVVDNPLHPYGPVTLEFQDINLDIPAPLPPHPLRFQADGHLPGETSGSFELSGSIRRAEGDHIPIAVELRVRGLDAAQLASAMGLPGGAAKAFTGTLDVEGKAVGEWPRLDLETDVDLQRLGVTLAKDTGKAPGDKARLRAKGRWEGDQLDLSDMNLLWKGQTIVGRLHLATQQSPRLQFWLNTPDLSLEPIMALVAATDSSGTNQASAPRTPKVPSTPLSQGGTGTDLPRTTPLSGNGRLQVEGHLRSSVLRWRKVILTTAESDIHYCCRLLTIRRLQGGLYGGTVSGDVALDWRGPTSRTTVTTHLEGVQTEPLLGAIQEPRWTLRGIMTLDSKMELSGQLGPGALAKVTGQTDIAVTNGRVTGYAPLEQLSKAADPVLKALGINAPTLNEFDRLSAHWILDGGILRTRDLTLLRDGAKLYAAGSFNLLNQTMDFDVKAKIAKTTLEAKLQGPSSDPVVTPQAGSIEGRIKTEVGKLLGKDGKKEIGKMLQQLFSR
jgi:AsmA protein